MKTLARVTYDAKSMGHILGFECESICAVPEAADGEIVIYYAGWELGELRACRAGRKNMEHQDWYDDQKFAVERGYYRLILPRHESHPVTIRAAPICVAVAAALAYLGSFTNLPRTDFCYCAETHNGDPIGIAVIDGRMGIYKDVLNPNDRRGNVWGLRIRS